MPIVARTVSRLTGRLPLRHIDPDRAIALGAAVASGIKARDAKLDEVILTDVCPYTLGIDVAKRDAAGVAHEGYLLPVINRNSTVPISREEEIWPLTDDQTKLRYDVYQGENPIAAKNVKLGAMVVDLPKNATRQERGTLVRFTYDVNGILQVEVTTAARLAEFIFDQGQATVDRPADVRAWLESITYKPQY